MLLLGLSILGSCNKEGGGSGNAADTLVGNWVVDEGASAEYEVYAEFSKGGLMKVYALYPLGSSATYDKGVLYAPADCEWKVYNTDPYTITDGVLFAYELWGMTLEVVNKDKIRLFCDGDEVFLLRVKGFKTE